MRVSSGALFTGTAVRRAIIVRPPERDGAAYLAVYWGGNTWRIVLRPPDMDEALYVEGASERELQLLVKSGWKVDTKGGLGA